MEDDDLGEIVIDAYPRCPHCMTVFDVAATETAIPYFICRTCGLSATSRTGQLRR